MVETNNILAILDNYLHDNPDEIAKEIAADFRRRRIEKNLTREQVAEKSGVAVSNIVRFEQKGLISLKNLISIAMALEYTSEIHHVHPYQATVLPQMP
jgi:transcriptional regulator with XRE-family HTH domain